MADEQEQDKPQDEAAEDASKYDLDAQVDKVMRDIESKSTYVLHAEPDVEDIDPVDIHPDDLTDAEDLVEVELERTTSVDELPEALEIDDVEQVEEEEEQSEEEQHEEALRRRSRLRHILVLVVIILVVIAVVLAVFIWHDSVSSVRESDTDALSTSSSGADGADLAAVDVNAVPDLGTLIGKTTSDATALCGDSLVLESKASKASDAAIPSMKSMLNGKLQGASGETLADIAFGLDKNSRIVYVYSSFDLDALGVGAASFDELVNSNKVPASLLEGLGVQASVAESAALTVRQNPNAIVSKDATGKEQAVFSGTPEAQGSIKGWRVTETYDHSVGQTLGDNSVMRTVLVELW